MKKEIYIWKKAPFTRLLIALIMGILLQWNLGIPPLIGYVVLSGSAMVITCFFFLPLYERYHWIFINGMAIHLAFTALGVLLTWHHDIRHAPGRIGSFNAKDIYYSATLEESPVKKSKSFKAAARITFLQRTGQISRAKGEVLIYFTKDSLPQVHYGSQIIFKKPLQEIKNTGNPGGFDYERYCLFQGITHQVFLQPGDYVIAHGSEKKWLTSRLNAIRDKVLHILRTYIKGGKETGLAEALLIGYKDDLDKNLVQSYSNTGVVHIIAISGLHLGLIYWLLVGLLKPLQGYKYGKWARMLIIIGGLWLFSLLAGAQPSILRSAVMFTCIVIGENLTKKTTIYNSLASSAFLLLCYNPFWLWDAGFQLSYIAVLSLVVFMRPVYNVLYIKNRLLDWLWQINAVTIAAQLLAVPVSVYHFHQLPVLFIFTNLVAVPLSGIILLGEIALCAVSLIPPLAVKAGHVLSWLISLMNGYIEKIDEVPFSVWGELRINIIQLFLLYIFIAALSHWLFEKNKPALLAALAALALFFVIRGFSFWHATRQQTIIVYNVAGQQAIDMLKGRKFHFYGDAQIGLAGFAHSFHVRPSRILHRVSQGQTTAPPENGHLLLFAGKKILLAGNNAAGPLLPASRQDLDLVIFSKKSRLPIPALLASFRLKKIIFDSSVPPWKAKAWKKDCDSLGIPFYDVNEKGAFVMSLN